MSFIRKPLSNWERVSDRGSAKTSDFYCYNVRSVLLKTTQNRVVLYYPDFYDHCMKSHVHTPVTYFTRNGMLKLD